MKDIKKMDEKTLIEEINLLARKNDLSVEEKELQSNLRKEYIFRVKSSLKAHLDNIKTDKK